MFKKLLVEYIKEKVKKDKELHVYDFDYTLYKEDSNAWIEETVLSAKNSISDNSVIAIICTARDLNQRNYVESLLNKKGLLFDEIFLYNRKEPVATYKARVIKEKLDFKDFNIIKVKLWEDNKENILAIKKIVKLYKVPIKVTHVKK